jgi:hypothetical protein
MSLKIGGLFRAVEAKHKQDNATVGYNDQSKTSITFENSSSSEGFHYLAFEPISQPWSLVGVTLGAGVSTGGDFGFVAGEYD